MKSLSSLFSDDFKSFKDDISVIPSGIEYLDLFIKGIPRAKFSLIVGLEGSGKTTLLLQLGLSFLRNVPDSVVCLYDTEHSITMDRFKSLGYNNDDLNRIFIPDVDVITIENIFNTFESEIQKIRINNQNNPILLLWDSIAQTPPEAEVEGKVGESEVGLRARLLSQIFRKYTSLFNAADVTVVAVNQLRYKIQVMPFEDPYVCPGGKAAEFAAWMWLDLRRSKDFEYVDKHRIVDIRLRKNKFSPPVRFSMVLDPVTGFSSVWSTFNALLDNKIIKDEGRGFASFKHKDLPADKFKIISSWPEIYSKNKEQIFDILLKI